MPAQSFEIDVAVEGDELVARVGGELDLNARTQVTEAVVAKLQNGGVGRLVMDLGGVTFCDSSGLGALLDIRRAAGEAGVDMLLRTVSRPVSRLLDLTDVDAWLRRE
jgi:anti-sigma B factor antagonist